MMEREDPNPTSHEELPPFDEYSACAACGYKRNREVRLQATYCDGCQHFGNRPHFHRQCTTCSYIWAEATLLDAGDQE